MPNCPVHQKEMKPGKFAGSWYCSTPIGKDENDKTLWCQEGKKLKKPVTPSEKFDDGMARSGAQNDSHKKDVTITRLAIVKSLIEAGYKHGLDAMTEYKWWFDLAEGRNPLAQSVEAPKPAPVAPVPPPPSVAPTAPMTNAALVPETIPDEEIDLNSIPF